MESAEFHEWLDAETHRLDHEVEDRVIDAHVLGVHGVIEHARNDAISEIRRSAGKVDDDEKLDRAAKRKIINDVAERIRRTGPSMGEVWLTKYRRGHFKSARENLKIYNELEGDFNRHTQRFRHDIMLQLTIGIAVYAEAVAKEYFRLYLERVGSLVDDMP